MKHDKFCNMLDRRIKNYESDMGQAIDAAMKETKEFLKLASSGSKGDPALLRRNDHPYAKRHGPTGLWNPSFINIGLDPRSNSATRFSDSWRDSRVLYEGYVYNVSPIGHYLEDGMGKMVKRTILDLLEKNVNPELVMEKALNKIWRKVSG